jgi:agmatinase
VELYDIETDSQVYLHGIFTDEPVAGDLSPEDDGRAVRRPVQDHLANNKFVVLVGGEHSVSIGAIQAHARRFPGMSVLQLDAHADLRDEYEGSRYNHACVMARAKELVPDRPGGHSEHGYLRKAGHAAGPVFFAENIHDNTRLDRRRSWTS